jgi:CheY-like chemotaxis protein
MPAPKILVVDDQPINVQLLKRKLEREGMQVIAAYSGQEALDLVAKDNPDLILLDVMMPEMDGIEVCQRLQASEETRSIPVIFVTARSSKEGKLEGLGVGAVDYITKPIDLDETLARVQTQLRFAAINREIIDLQRRLTESRRAATIGAVTQGIAHNLNNLLGVVIGYLDLIKAYAEKPELVRKNAQNVEDAVQRIVVIIRQLSSLVVKTRLNVTRIGVQRILEGGVQRYVTEYKINQPVVINNPLGDLIIETHVEVFEEVLSKILINAWESYPDGTPPDQRPITITIALLDTDEGKVVEIRIEDQGRGIDPEIRDHMFEPFISGKRTVGVGMGLTVARHSLRNIGGEVTVEDRPGGGAVAILLHPIAQPKRKAASEQTAHGPA